MLNLWKVNGSYLNEAFISSLLLTIAKFKHPRKGIIILLLKWFPLI
jgi:hypothetical protein